MSRSLALLVVASAAAALMVNARSSAVIAAGAAPQSIDLAERLAAGKLRALNREVTPLKGDRKGQYSIRINDQFRICFRWRDGDAHDVEIVDYH